MLEQSKSEVDHGNATVTESVIKTNSLGWRAYIQLTDPWM